MSFTDRRKRRGGRRRGKVTLKKVNRKVNKIINSQEVKIFDGVFALVPTVAGVIAWISPIVQGDDTNEREGNELLIKSIDIDFHVHKSVSTSDVPAIVRVMVMTDQQPTNGIAGLNTILQVANETHSPIDRVSRGRFKFLYDRYFSMNAMSALLRNDTTEAWGSSIKHGTFHKKMSLKTTFNDNAVVIATGAGSSRKHLYIICITNTVAAATAVHGIVRLRYLDS